MSCRLGLMPPKDNKFNVFYKEQERDKPAYRKMKINAKISLYFGLNIKINKGELKTLRVKNRTKQKSKLFLERRGLALFMV